MATSPPSSLLFPCTNTLPHCTLTDINLMPQIRSPAQSICFSPKSIWFAGFGISDEIVVYRFSFSFLDLDFIFLNLDLIDINLFPFMEIAFYDVTRTGELLSRLSEDTQIINNVATTNLSEALRNLTTAFISLGFIAGFGCCTNYISSYFGRYLRELSHATQAAAAVAASIAEESFGAIRTVRSFAQESYAVSTYSEKVDKTLNFGLRQAPGSLWTIGKFDNFHRVHFLQESMSLRKVLSFLRSNEL
ncbi:hypothetical protein L2E82_06911 [Cichorium intybus]|uniref:Uncharacterized protein n=1 Tax=Cichorium intybus TaxID=13427 RepID=A0ACB9G2Z1_CICIN|nr:hypothetical protein L2E82_06911 [Cichorium intybus]